jgi:hypothetical protein
VKSDSSFRQSLNPNPEGQNDQATGCPALVLLSATLGQGGFPVHKEKCGAWNSFFVRGNFFFIHNTLKRRSLHETYQVAVH